MHFWDKKQTVTFSDIIRGLQQAINSAQDMLQESHMNKIQLLFGDKGTPQTKTIMLGDRVINVPLIALIPHNQLSMDEVEIKFKTRVGEISTDHTPNLMGTQDKDLSFANMQMEMNGISADAKDVMEVTIRFKAKDTPEGMARLLDEYNKQI